MRSQANPKWRLPATLIALLLAVTACGPTGDGAASPGDGAASPGDGAAASPTAGDGEIGQLTFLSSQLAPVEEAETMRNEILADFGGEVEFVPSEAGPFIDQIRAQAGQETGNIDVVGGLHGDFAALDAELFMDISDLRDELSDLGIAENFLDLGRLDTDSQIYIPWMQATYIMAARTEALDHLPEGADLNNLTWDQVTEWGRNIADETGSPRLGFPAGEDGLLHRFFQGYAYPSFTGGVNTTFASDQAVEMWNWMTDTWQYVNPQSTTYGFMQEPLQSGEVWVAWDHVARLIDALRADPEAYVAFPVPSGPEGRGFMPVLAGLAIPVNAPNPDGARELIRYMLRPETQAKTLEGVAFFPVIDAELPGDLEPAIQAEQEAVTAQTTADDAVPSLLPVGLGEESGAYNKVFQDTFRAIVLDGRDPSEVLDEQAATLQSVLETAGASCWPPDPPSDGVCQVEGGG